MKRLNVMEDFQRTVSYGVTAGDDGRMTLRSLLQDRFHDIEVFIIADMATLTRGDPGRDPAAVGARPARLRTVAQGPGDSGAVPVDWAMTTRSRSSTAYVVPFTCTGTGSSPTSTSKASAEGVRVTRTRVPRKVSR